MQKTNEKTVLYPVMTEDAVNLIDTDNKLTFIVNGKSSKPNVKKAIEKLYDVKVESVNILITPKGQKKAYIRLSPENKASDVALRLGIL